MEKASRLFAREEMKKAAREFRELAKGVEMLHPSYGKVDEDKLLEDYFLAGALWYRETLKEKVMSKKIPQPLFFFRKICIFKKIVVLLHQN